MMPKMIRVGLYREFEPYSSRAGRLPSIQGSLASEPHPEESRIVRYLNQGIPVSACGGTFGDVLDPRVPHTLTAHTLTDGVYGWGADLSYYVERYHLRLPDQFIEHMKRNNWSIPSNIDPASMDGWVGEEFEGNAPSSQEG
jgi:hypothetical protein